MADSQETPAITPEHIRAESAYWVLSGRNAYAQYLLKVADALEASDAARARLEADIQAYRGALGYPVPGAFGECLSDGTRPVNGIAQALEAEVTRLTAALAQRELALRSIANNSCCSPCQETALVARVAL